MRVTFWLILVATLIAVVLAYIRLAPSDPARWHVDPMMAERPSGDGWLVRPEGGNERGAVHACSPETLLDALDKIALAYPRTRHLAGSMAEGQITYISRSKVFGFPDYTTVTTLDVDGGATPAIFARQRFGQKDMGVNRARIEAWTSSLNAVPECPPVS
ncbi:DUF1499 domain-containing protein [Oceaniglobus indicus]|uniref:DUF1499 domain-containing protein n=1 Tax=Oceaniglobus indicus TaxID=2047749 RepID=UPI000C1892C4|nr:DUF1499 domain-containing protein [Oceaniglobus indicus]